MMNQSIRKLAEQAGFNLHNDPIDGHDNTHEIKKFAELIVEECIKLNAKELAMAGHSRMVDVYCEHFGIEY